jgi:dihydroxyacetone kinase DhaKLM complex PTS-EIIA-like component DhaM
MISAITRDYCQRYGLESVRLAEVSGVSEGAAAVCDIVVDFVDGYRVRFKLPVDHTPAANGIVELGAGGEVHVEHGGSGTDEAALAAFFQRIETRLAKVQHEQSVQNITYLGNTFVLNDKTVFDVVGDEDGRLAIEMHRGEERKPAMLLASALLDGLYDGSIRLHK